MTNVNSNMKFSFLLKKRGEMKVIFIVCFLSSVLFGQILYEEYFTGGAMQLDWHPWFTDENGFGDSMMVINDSTTPGGDDWAGSISNEYMTVAGLTYAGDQNLTDYSIEAWIYTIVTPGVGGPYNGIALRMDTTTRYYYRLVSDFDDNARLRLGLVASGGFPITLKDWGAGEIPGGVPSTSSWHKFKLMAIDDSLWCYYDDVMLPECPLVNDSVAQGFFGVYTFDMMDTAITKCDNIIVRAEETGLLEETTSKTCLFAVYPNPFRDKIDITFQIADCRVQNDLFYLKIYDVNGRLVKDINLQSKICDQRCSLSWDGRDRIGNVVAPGVYFIARKNHNQLIKVVKLH